MGQNPMTIHWRQRCPKGRVKGTSNRAKVQQVMRHSELLQSRTQRQDSKARARWSKQ